MAMPRLTKIYTRQGDGGTTALGSGQRVPKDHPRVRAYGAVDELNAVIGTALAHGLCDRLAKELSRVQNDLFHLGADLAVPPADRVRVPGPRIEARHVEKLEKLIDEFTQVTGPLENFILPGGSLGAAYLEVARTVCRRAEREVVALAREEAIGPEVAPYLNRLSDALFAMARYENHQRGVPETLWDPQA